MYENVCWTAPESGVIRPSPGSRRYPTDRYARMQHQYSLRCRKIYHANVVTHFYMHELVLFTYINVIINLGETVSKQNVFGTKYVTAIVVN